MESKHRANGTALRNVSAILFILVIFAIVSDLLLPINYSFFIKKIMNYDLGQSAFLLYGYKRYFFPVFQIVLALTSLIAAICLFLKKISGALISIIVYSYFMAISGFVITFIEADFRPISLCYSLLYLVIAVLITVARKKNVLIPLIIMSIVLSVVWIAVYKIYSLQYLVWLLSSILAVIYNNIENKKLKKDNQAEIQTDIEEPKLQTTNKTIGTSNTLKK